MIEKQQEELSLIRQEIVHLDKRWATGAYDCECFDPDEFRRLQLDVEAIERIVEGLMWAVYGLGVVVEGVVNCAG